MRSNIGVHPSSQLITLITCILTQDFVIIHLSHQLYNETLLSYFSIVSLFLLNYDKSRLFKYQFDYVCENNNKKIYGKEGEGRFMMCDVV